jgi:hypothetical protein
MNRDRVKDYMAGVHQEQNQQRISPEERAEWAALDARDYADLETESDGYFEEREAYLERLKADISPEEATEWASEFDEFEGE